MTTKAITGDEPLDSAAQLDVAWTALLEYGMEMHNQGKLDDRRLSLLVLYVREWRDFYRYLKETWSPGGRYGNDYAKVMGWQVWYNRIWNRTQEITDTTPDAPGPQEPVMPEVPDAPQILDAAISEVATRIMDAVEEMVRRTIRGAASGLSAAGPLTLLGIIILGGGAIYIAKQKHT